ncbi:MAG: T9SS type B sorting domain-containing protein [Bacteroidales bacterium]|nr:T9SS type B sorting domain-containing protein [Bacteroidales bacterium]MBN2817685.1 T9SS type B sorting domain-containing protein [Bacteroidales bacterium]
MRVRYIILFIFLLSVDFHAATLTQECFCDNLDFSSGSFTNWKGYTWEYVSSNDKPKAVPIEGFVYRRHTIISDTNAYDPITNNRLKIIPPGYKYVAKIGDITTRNDDTIRNWRQSLRYDIDVNSTNTLLTAKFALVIKNLFVHDSNSEHHFQISLLNEHGKLIETCANLDICGSEPIVDNFRSISHLNTEGYYENVDWLDWTDIAIDLRPYIGRKITVEFLVEDCTLPSSEWIGQWTTCFGYGYFVASCEPFDVQQTPCDLNMPATITAPDKFETYTWYNHEGSEVSHSGTLSIPVAVSGENYSCIMRSIQDCDVVLEESLMDNPDMEADFSYDFSCDSNKVQLQNHSTTESGSLYYFWTFEDGQTSIEPEPEISFLNSGIHEASLSITNSITGCSEMLSQEIESFSVDEINFEGTDTYCPGESTWIKGAGASEYEWNTGSTTDSIEISAPGGNFWMIGSSKNMQCISDTIFFSVSEDTDWDFRIEGDTVLCWGEVSALSAVGPVAYFWNDTNYTTELVVVKAGSHTCTGINSRGCEKTIGINVIESPPPPAEFFLSDTIINARNYIITANAVYEPDVEYVWDMGDDQKSVFGPNITYPYDYSNPGRTYTCTLHTTNEYGCTNWSSDHLVVMPYFPNVFSPNGDGVNDIFMEGAEIEVFDRNGTLYHKGSNGWDGKLKGAPADQDTYFYKVTYSYYDQIPIVKKGYVSLVR